MLGYSYGKTFGSKIARDDGTLASQEIPLILWKLLLLLLLLLFTAIEFSLGGISPYTSNK